MNRRMWLVLEIVKKDLEFSKLQNRVRVEVEEKLTKEQKKCVRMMSSFSWVTVSCKKTRLCSSLHMVQTVVDPFALGWLSQVCFKRTTKIYKKGIGLRNR